MGKKSNPLSFRFIKYYNYYSIWFCKKSYYSYFLHEDKKIRKLIKNNIKFLKFYIYYEIYYIEIKRKINLIQIVIHIISNYYVLNNIKNIINKLRNQIIINILYKNNNLIINKIKNTYLYPNIITKFIINQLKKTISLNKILKKILKLTEKIIIIKGIKIKIAGKIYNKEKQYYEYIKEGLISLQTIKKKIYYNIYKIKTKYGILSIKIWIFI
uniref:Small ribosomal subunit protein uS3c n=1 Tax=Rhopalocnemis phalloides TaxID=1128106 RepID=A0A8K1Y0W6_9MAGN|nr:ribosomal protein S3 [Rhopalocnemis phalloides]